MDELRELIYQCADPSDGKDVSKELSKLLYQATTVLHKTTEDEHVVKDAIELYDIFIELIEHDAQIQEIFKDLEYKVISYGFNWRLMNVTTKYMPKTIYRKDTHIDIIRAAHVNIGYMKVLLDNKINPENVIDAIYMASICDKTQYLDLFQESDEKFACPPNCIDLCVFCKSVDSLKWWAKWFDLNNQPIQYQNFGINNWTHYYSMSNLANLMTKFPSTISISIRNVARENKDKVKYTDVLDFLFEHNLILYIETIIRRSCGAGLLEVIEWFWNKSIEGLVEFKYDSKKCIKDAVLNHRISILNFLYDKHTKCGLSFEYDSTLINHVYKKFCRQELWLSMCKLQESDEEHDFVNSQWLYGTEKERNINYNDSVLYMDDNFYQHGIYPLRVLYWWKKHGLYTRCEMLDWIDPCVVEDDKDAHKEYSTMCLDELVQFMTS